MTKSSEEQSISLISGRFLRELNNRFLCEVEVQGETNLCYVPSSCHLGNFLQLNGKNVLLIENRGKNTRTKYALYACPYKKSYILLSPAIANKAVEECVQSRRFSFLGARKDFQPEKTINGYKADLFIHDTNTIVEIKAVIAASSEAMFPTVYSERTLKQLALLQERLHHGEKAALIIVSLNPYTKRITINEASEFAVSLAMCVSLGLVVKAFTCRLNKDKEPAIDHSIPIIWPRMEGN